MSISPSADAKASGDHSLKLAGFAVTSMGVLSRPGKRPARRNDARRYRRARSKARSHGMRLTYTASGDSSDTLILL